MYHAIYCVLVKELNIVPIIGICSKPKMWVPHSGVSF